MTWLDVRCGGNAMTSAPNHMVFFSEPTEMNQPLVSPVTVPDSPKKQTCLEKYLGIGQGYVTWWFIPRLVGGL